MVIELLVLALLLAAPVAMMLATRVVIVASPWRVPFALAFVVWAIAGVASLPAVAVIAVLGGYGGWLADEAERHRRALRLKRGERDAV